jgi:hypothetical protein
MRRGVLFILFPPNHQITILDHKLDNDKFVNEEKCNNTFPFDFNSDYCAE